MTVIYRYVKHDITVEDAGWVPPIGVNVLLKFDFRSKAEWYEVREHWYSPHDKKVVIEVRAKL